MKHATLLTAVLLSLMLPLAGVAAAHDTPPLRTIRTQAGPYPIVVGLYTDPPRVAAVAALTVTLPNEGAGQRVTLAASPGPGVDANPIRGRADPDGAERGVWVAAIVLTTRGAWNLEITVSGTEGTGTARVPVVAVEEGAIAEPVAWAIGLAPLAGLIAFALRERRRLDRALRNVSYR